MLDGITQWIKHTILVVMFTSFVGFLLPHNRFLKYANVLLGLIVMITIATPLITLMRYDFSMDDLQWIFEDANREQEVLLRTDILTKTNEAIALRQYKNQIDSAVYEYLQGLSTIEVVEVNTLIDGDLSQGGLGTITGAEVMIRPKAPGVKPSAVVKKIVVGGKSQNRDHVHPEISVADVTRIQEYLENQLGLPKEKITLQWEE